jgi:hypothetical protein
VDSAIALCDNVQKSGKAGGAAVKDYQASIEKLRRDAAEAKLISDFATDKTKREMFARLHQHFNQLADEVDRAMKAGNATGLSQRPGT